MSLRNFLLLVLTVPTLASYLEQCKKTPIEENVTLKGGIGAGTFKKMGKVTQMKSCIELCCKDISCDVAFMSAQNCYAVECVSNDECESTTTDTSDVQVLIAHVKKKPKKNNSTLDVLANPGLLAKKNPLATGANPAMAGMAGQCKAGKTYKEVTLRGGINAGTYKDTGLVKGMTECQEKCCGFSACDLAFLLGGRCYLVGCSDERSCQMNKAKPSVFTPMISYVTRWNTEGVKHTVHFESPGNETQYTCPEMVPLTKVTLKGGLKAGDFTDVGKVGKLQDCYDICCKNEKCHLAFMLGQNCFNVKCYNSDLCKTIPAQPSIFNPQIAYVATRSKMTLKEAIQDQLQKNDVEHVSHVTCPRGHVVDKVTLAGGINAGRYRDHGKVENITMCRRICCEIPTCNVAFMISQNCFTVECKTEVGCRSQPAVASPYNPRISYVRFLGSANIIGVYDDLNSTVKNATKNIDELFKDGKLPSQQILSASKQNAGKPPTQKQKSQPKQQTLNKKISPNKSTLLINGDANDLVTALQGAKHTKPHSNQATLNKQLKKAKAGEAMSIAMVNGQLKLTPANAKNDDKNANPKKTKGSPKNNPVTTKKTSATKSTCTAIKNMKDVTLSGGKHAGKFTDHGSVDSMDKCLDFCCKDKKCNLVLMLDKACYSVECKDKKSCEPLPAPPSNFTPKLAVVRPAKGKSKPKVQRPHIPDLPKNLKCNYKPISNDKKLVNGKKAGTFKLAEGVTTMSKCMETCCDESMCDLVYLDQGKCFTVTCSTPDTCKTENVGKDESSVLMAFTSPVETQKVKDSTEDEVNMEEGEPRERMGLQCRPSKITRNTKLKGAKLTNAGTVKDLQECIKHCCKKDRCDAAYMDHKHCFTVECQDGLQCQSFREPAEKNSGILIAYMQRSLDDAQKEKDWVIVYVIVGSLVCASGLSGIAWASCICIRRNRLRNKRRLLDDADDDEEEEMLPKQFSRYNNPVPRRYR